MISPHPSALLDREEANNTHYLAVGSVSAEQALPLMIYLNLQIMT